MMGHREKLVGGAEFDALRHRSKRVHAWRPGERQAIKRRYWKRVRRQSVVEDGAGETRQ